jgi:chromosome partitioning protein
MITVVGNLKGGTGKSTVAFNLATWLVHRGRSVTLFDLDPQFTLRDVVDVRLQEGFEPPLPLAGDARAFQQFSEILTDEVVIDVSIADRASMLAAIERADRVVVPCAPSQADIWSTQKFLSIIASEVVANKDRQILAFINRADTHHLVVETQEAEDALSQLSGITVLPAKLYQRTAYRRSFSEGLAVFELNSRDKAAQEMEDLAALLYPSLALGG